MQISIEVSMVSCALIGPSRNASLGLSLHFSTVKLVISAEEEWQNKRSCLITHSHFNFNFYYLNSFRSVIVAISHSAVANFLVLSFSFTFLWICFVLMSSLTFQVMLLVDAKSILLWLSWLRSLVSCAIIFSFCVLNQTFLICKKHLLFQLGSCLRP